MPSKSAIPCAAVGCLTSRRSPVRIRLGVLTNALEIGAPGRPQRCSTCASARTQPRRASRARAAKWTRSRHLGGRRCRNAEAAPRRRGCCTNRRRWRQATTGWRAARIGRVRSASHGLRGIGTIDLSRHTPLVLALEHKQFPVRHLRATASVQRISQLDDSPLFRTAGPNREVSGAPRRRCPVFPSCESWGRRCCGGWWVICPQDARPMAFVAARAIARWWRAVDGG